MIDDTRDGIESVSLRCGPRPGMLHVRLMPAAKPTDEFRISLDLQLLDDDTGAVLATLPCPKAVDQACDLVAELNDDEARTIELVADLSRGLADCDNMAVHHATDGLFERLQHLHVTFEGHVVSVEPDLVRPQMGTGPQRPLQPGCALPLCVWLWPSLMLDEELVLRRIRQDSPVGLVTGAQQRGRNVRKRVLQDLTRRALPAARGRATQSASASTLYLRAGYRVADDLQEWTGSEAELDPESAVSASCVPPIQYSDDGVTWTDEPIDTPVCGGASTAPNCAVGAHGVSDRNRHPLRSSSTRTSHILHDFEARHGSSR